MLANQHRITSERRERGIVSERDRAERAYGFLNFIYIFEFFIFRPTKDEVRQAESAFCHRQCNIFATPAPASQLSTLWFL